MLDGRQQRQVDAHLDGCADCREELRILNAVVCLVEEHGALNPPVGLFNGVRNRIEAGDFVRERPAWWAIFMTKPARVGAMAMAMGAVVLGLVMPTGPATRVHPPLPMNGTGVGSMASGELASSVRQHAMSAVEGPLADRVAWEAMAQIATQSLSDEAKAKERRVQ
jgi:hypothetical protein